jgi:hypothetical protein
VPVAIARVEVGAAKCTIAAKCMITAGEGRGGEVWMVIVLGISTA